MYNKERNFVARNTAKSFFATIHIAGDADRQSSFVGSG